MLKKTMVGGLGVVLGLGCGEAPIENLEVDLYPTPSRRDLEPLEVAELDVDGVHISFTRVWTPVDAYRTRDVDDSAVEEYSPSFMIEQYGPLSATVDPVGLLRANMPEAPTSGELYYGLTGEFPPEELAQYQTVEAERLGRSREFVAFEPEDVVSFETDKAFVDPAAWIGPVQAHHFEKQFFTQVPWTCSTPSLNTCRVGQPLPLEVNQFVCGDRSYNDIRGSYKPLWGYCGGIDKGWMRVGAANVGGDDTTAIVTQAWFGPSSQGQWTGGSTYSVDVNWYVVVDWNGTTYRQLAQLATRQRTANQQVRFYTTNIIPD